jgi:hypothetical protein
LISLGVFASIRVDAVRSRPDKAISPRARSPTAAHGCSVQRNSPSGSA